MAYLVISFHQRNSMFLVVLSHSGGLCELADLAVYLVSAVLFHVSRYFHREQ